MDAPSIAYFRRSPATAARVTEILGLPEEMIWSQLDVSVGLEQLAEAKLVVILTEEQLVALAQLAVERP